MTPTTKFKAALCGLALIAAAALPMSTATAELGYSTQTVRTLNVANIVAPAGNHPPGYPNYTIRPPALCAPDPDRG